MKGVLATVALTALVSVLRGRGGLWIGWAGTDDPETLPLLDALALLDEEPNDTYVEQLVASARAAVDELVRRFLADFPDRTVAIVSVDPSRRRSGGALLGDRIRMHAIDHPRVYMRSLATRGASG